MAAGDAVTEHVITGGAGAVGGAVLLQLVKWAKGKRQADARAAKDDAESAATIAGAWQTLLQPMQDEISRLSDEHKECEARATRQRADIEELKNEVATLKARMPRHAPGE